MTDTQAKRRVFFLANPNPPYGTCYSTNEIESFANRLQNTLIVLDEAYIDFAEADGRPLLDRCPNILISRTFSKSFSLAGMRLGWGMGNVDVIATLSKVKDSYNLDRLQQVAGAAALEAADDWREANEMIKNQRDRVAETLRNLGFDVPESGGNFLFPRNGPIPAERYFRELRERNILVRYFSIAELNNGVRVTIGTPQQMDRFLETSKEILSS